MHARLKLAGCFAGLCMGFSCAHAASPNTSAAMPSPGSQPEVQYLQQQQGGQNNIDNQQMRDHFELLDEGALASKPWLALSSLPGMQQAVEDANGFINACDDKLSNGILKNYLASVKCSNPAMIHAFELASYPHMDLMKTFAARREAIARRLDNHEITYSQRNELLNKALNHIYTAERARAITVRDRDVSPY